MSRPSSPARLAIILSSALLLVSLSIVVRFGDDEVMQVEDLQPPGRWHLQTSRIDEDAGETLARVLSLPYVSGSQSAPTETGVTRYDSRRALAGLNLYVSGHGPEALLIDMTGAVVHRWRYPFERAFPFKQPTLDTAYFRRAHLYPDGSLLAIYQGGGMIKLDRESNLLWSSDLSFYNHLHVDSDGQILAIAKSASGISELRPDGTVLEDSIVALSPAGEILSRMSLIKCFTASRFADLIHPLPDHADIFHTNTVLPIRESSAGSAAVLQPGLLVVSLREIDTVALIDPRAGSVEAAWRGPWRAQHQPVPLPTGRILLFDNKGAETGSRVVEFDPATGELVWKFPGEGRERLSSPEAGSCQRLSNGNTLITESEMGRALEVTPEGQLVWEFVSPHRAGRRQELVATLFDVVRHPFTDLTFVDNGGRD